MADVKGPEVRSRWYAAMSGVAALPPIAAAGFAAFAVSGGVNFLESKRERAPA